MFRIITANGETLEINYAVLKMTVETMGRAEFMRQAKVIMRIG